MKFDFVFPAVLLDIIESEKMTKTELDCIPDVSKTCRVVCPFAGLSKMK